MAKKVRKKRKPDGKPAELPANAPESRKGQNMRDGNGVPEGCYRDDKGVVRRIEEPLIDESMLDESPIDRLKGMRRVLRYGPSYDKLALHKMLRAWLKASPAAFMAAYERLEGEESKTVETSAAVGSAAARDDGYERGRDEVTPKLERLIENWLRETRERVEALP